MIKNIKNFLLDCIFPIYCLGCEKFIPNKKDSFACDDCLNKLEINSSFYCPNCLKRLPNQKGNQLQKCCDSKNSYLNSLGFAVNYQDPLIKSLIRNFKYRFAKKINITLANILLIYLEKSLLVEKTEDWLIIPIPLHKSRKNWRGFNQAKEIADIIGAKLNYKISHQDLIRIKKTNTQAKNPDFESRKENLANAFKVSTPENIKNRSLILVDDVRSSGATLEEAAKTLKSAGAKKIIGLVVAR